MKNTMLLFFVLLGLGLQAQTKLGFHLTANSSTINTSTGIDQMEFYKNRKAIGGGISIEQEFSSIFSLEGMLLYDPKGFAFKQRFDQKVFGINIPLGYNIKTNINYVKLPIFAKVKFGNEHIKGFLKAGPRIAYATDGNIQAQAKVLLNFNVLNKDIPFESIGLDRWEMGAAFGAGLEFPIASGAIVLEGGYDLGLEDMLALGIVDLPFRNQSFHINLGWKLNL